MTEKATSMVSATDSLRGLVNNFTRLGGDEDKARASEWHHTQIPMQKLEAAYRSNWIARKACDIVAFDMFREGWTWQAEKEVVAAIEREEQRHKLIYKAFEAMKWARLYGGAALVFSDGAEDPREPLDIENIGQGDIQFVSAVDRHSLASGPIDYDPLSPHYMEPEYYDLLSRTSGTVRVHPSRVVRFIGNPIPMGHRILVDHWGDSILEAVDIAIKDATSGQAGIAALIQEAKVDVFGIPSLTEKISTEKYKNALQDRFELANRLKGPLNALIKDKEEDYEQKTISFTNLPDVQRLLLQIVSGAVDIPATRFLSQSPAGLSSTGESDMRNYYDRIKAEQKLVLRPIMQKIFDIMVRSAVGQYPDDIYFQFDPLWQLTEKEQAEIGKFEADEIETLTRTGLIPDEVLAIGVRNRLIEGGRYPGIEQAYDEWGDDLVQEEEVEQPENIDPARIGDARPRTLYVRRQVVNAAEIVAWAKEQGFTDIIAPEDMHVTVIWSRQRVDWLKFRQDYEPKIEVEGGARIVEPLGIAGAIVLFFKSNMLEWRHREFIDGGVDWDFLDYDPHITITYSRGNMDFDAIEPFRGKIILGEEVWEEIDENVINPFIKRS